MAHFTKTGRNRNLRRVTAEWQPLASQVSKMANTWSRRIDLTAYVGPDGGRGLAAAIYDSATSEVEINTAAAFGPFVKPGVIADFTERSTHFDWPVAAGALLHEASHAAYTTDAMCLSHTVLDPESDRWFEMLDEPRIERYGVRNYPENREFLRACALQIVFKDSADSIPELTHTAAAAQTAILGLGRVDAGVLYPEDVKQMTVQINKVIPSTVLAKLRAIWIEFQELDGKTEINRMYELAREFAALVRSQSEINGDAEPPKDGEIPEWMQDLLDSIAGDKLRTEYDAEDRVFDQRMKEKLEDERKRDRQDAADQMTNKGQAQSTFRDSNGPKGTRSRSELVSVREPTDDERKVASQIGAALKRAKYRDRLVTTRDRADPPGRLNMSASIQNSVSRTQGMPPTAEPWRDKIRVHIDDPNLTVGIMCDISGSMGAAMKPIAVSTWVMSKAVQRVKGRTAAVYFGNDVFSVLKPGEFLKEVTEYSASDGMEDFDRGFRALDGGLQLLAGSGARLLVVCSDGQYGGTGQLAACVKWLQACRDVGVAVVWLSYKLGGARLDHIAEATGATVVPVGTDITAAATAIGAACIAALQKASR